MEPGAFGTYAQLQIRAWTIDHNGRYFTKRYHELVVSQYPGQKVISDLKYVPNGYLPNEEKRRLELIERGKLYWHYGSQIHHACYMVDKVCHGMVPLGFCIITFLTSFLHRQSQALTRIIIDQGLRPFEPPLNQELEDQFQQTRARS